MNVERIRDLEDDVRSLRRVVREMGFALDLVVVELRALGAKPGPEERLRRACWPRQPDATS
jgi:hypothetical protein